MKTDAGVCKIAFVHSSQQILKLLLDYGGILADFGVLGELRSDELLFLKAQAS